MSVRLNLKKITAGALAATMSIALVPKILGNDVVLADGTKNQSNTSLGVSGISNPTAPESSDSPWTGNYVYYGTFDGSPIKFRVLQKDCTAYSTDKTIFLDSDTTLLTKCFDDNSFVWDGSEIQEYLNDDFLESFSSTEQNAITNSEVETHPLDSETTSYGTVEHFVDYIGLNGEKVFLLDVEEISNASYGYKQGRDAVTCRIKDGVADTWRLRSFECDYNDRNHFAAAGYVDDNGYMAYTDVRTELGIAPALNVNQNDILFASSVSGETGSYKLTIIDSDLSITIPSDKQVSVDGTVITIPYSISGTSSGNATRVSVLILDDEYTAGNTNGADILYYDSLGSVSDSGAEFTLPSTFDLSDWDTEYYIYIVAEDINGDKETDYASEPLLIANPDVPNEVLATAGCTITKPHEGDVMDSVPVSDEPDKYDVVFDGWYVCSEPDYPTLTSTDTYKAGKTYAIRVYFKAKDGYEFDDDTKFTINGEYYGKFTPNSPSSLGVETRFITATDTPYTGWVENGLNWKYYVSGEPVKGWKQIGGIWYHFNEYGSMQKRWQEIDGVRYYFKTSGAMVTGWLLLDDVWYYFTGSGAMQKGWQKINGTWYYFNDSGAMVTGWEQVDGTWYYFKDSGAMVTGWQEIDGVYYYFKSSGAMAANEYCGGYWLNPNGKWTYTAKASWYKDDKGWYYQDTNGWYAKNGTWTIDGVDYDFDSRGYCTNP